jgi:enoyl-CoA hydratase/carnithine racemase
VLVVTSNRSENRNALSDNIIEGLGQIDAHVVTRRRGHRGLLLRGAGCVGVAAFLERRRPARAAGREAESGHAFRVVSALADANRPAEEDA